MSPSRVGQYLLRAGQGCFLVGALLGAWWIKSSTPLAGAAAGRPAETPAVTAWSIANKYDLQPETILWDNETLSANAGSLMIGDVLNILPVDDVLHTVKEGETLENNASRHGVLVEAIVQFIGNGFDLLPPFDIAAGQQLIVPGGRNPVVWQEPGPPVVPGEGRKSPGLYSGPLVYIRTFGEVTQPSTWAPPTGSRSLPRTAAQSSSPAGLHRGTATW